jgi:uncharacterized protein (TIGR02145 family)
MFFSEHQPHKVFCIFIITVLCMVGKSQWSNAQTVVGGTVSDQSAILDVQSSSKGVLFPRLSTSQRDSIGLPAVGLMLYNTTTMCLEINLGNANAPNWTSIKCQGSVSSLDCANAAQTGTLFSGTAASGVSVQVPYTGGNGGSHAGQTVTSTGVTGLTATLASGSFAAGDDSLSYTITGTPDSVGTASFALSIGGQSCTLELTAETPPTNCWALVGATDTLYFMCQNLASANTSADPFTPSWEINGGYWQWGRKGPDASQWLNTNTTEFAHGPTGPGAGEANDASIAGWNQTGAPNGAWSDNTKTANDPCPAGFRVPTIAQWNAVIANNNGSAVGTDWTDSATNYSTGRSFGTNLMLPAAGSRLSANGTLISRGESGVYWSSTELEGDPAAEFLVLYNGSTFNDAGSNKSGLSVRCAAE